MRKLLRGALEFVCIGFVFVVGVGLFTWLLVTFSPTPRMVVTVGAPVPAHLCSTSVPNVSWCEWFEEMHADRSTRRFWADRDPLGQAGQEP